MFCHYAHYLCSFLLYYSPIIRIPLFDGQPHHICVSSEFKKSETIIKGYIDGIKKQTVPLGRTLDAIPKGHQLVIGQGPSYQNSSYNTADSFEGEISGFNIWDTFGSSSRRIVEIYRGNGAEKGNVIGWRNLKTKTHGGLEILQGSPLESQGIYGSLQVML